MENLIKEWDGESLVVRYDKPTGAWIYIAIHSTKLGPATGGTRMKPYKDLEAALQEAAGTGGPKVAKADISVVHDVPVGLSAAPGLGRGGCLDQESLSKTPGSGGCHSSP